MKLNISYDIKDRAKMLFRAANCDLKWNPEVKSWETSETREVVEKKLLNVARGSIPVGLKKFAFNFLDEILRNDVNINARLGR
jgi:hypothetical protein